MALHAQRKNVIFFQDDVQFLRLYLLPEKSNIESITANTMFLGLEIIFNLQRRWNSSFTHLVINLFLSKTTDRSIYLISEFTKK